MAKWTGQNETGHPDAPPTDFIRLYPYGDGLYYQDDAGNQYKLVASVGDYVYLFGDADTDDSVRWVLTDDAVTLQRRISGVWTDLVAHSAE